VIAQLRGTLADKRPNQVLVDVGGVGYLVFIPLSTFYGLGELHGEVTLLTYTHVREDALALYGFVTAHEKHVFELLISVSGVGPALALKILSGMTADDLAPAIRAGDLVRLTRIPGVGRKTAERIVVELRDKLAATGVPETAQPSAVLSSVATDVVSALLNLGYDKRDAEQAVETAGKDGTPDTFEGLLRASLQQLSALSRKGAGAPAASRAAR
jgi:holliday junction DNA helicase RuvA